jgi:hypothetical protein
MGRKIRSAISLTTSRGVKCSPASSLFSSLKRRISSSKMVPMAWLSRPGRRTVAVGAAGPARAEVDVAVEELLDELAEDVGLDQGGDLVAELELVEDLLHVGREAVEVGFEVGLELVGRARARRSRRVKGEVL